jgi:hypothetical protein
METRSAAVRGRIRVATGEFPLRAVDKYCRRSCFWQACGAIAIVGLIWLNEILDLPHFLMGAPKTPVNWRESILETFVVLPVFGFLIVWTRRTTARLRLLEGLLPVCSNCKKIRDEKGDWSPMESYIHQRARVDFSHGICPDCLVKFYPEVARSRSSDPPSSTV